DGISLPDVASMTPYQATRVLIEALPLSAVEHVVSILQEEMPLPEDAFRSYRSMTWDMVARIHKAGIIVGSHTKSHVLLTNENERRVMEEVAGSRAEIERRLGSRVRHFAYPSGLFDASSITAVAAAGYRYGYTGCRHRSTQYPSLTV